MRSPQKPRIELLAALYVISVSKDGWQRGDRGVDQSAASLTHMKARGLIYEIPSRKPGPYEQSKQGRPAKLWRLTEQGQKVLDAHPQYRFTLPDEYG